MTTNATSVASPNASSNAPRGVVKSPRRPDETLTDYFGRVLTDNGVSDDGSVAIVVNVHDTAGTGGLPGLKRREVPWPSFDEGTLGLPAGSYVLQLKTAATGRIPLASQVIRLADDAVGVPPPAPPAAGGQGIVPQAPPSMAIDPNAMFLKMFESQAQTNALLLKTILTPQQPRNMFEELTSMLELTRKVAPKVDGGGGSAIADAIREVVPMALDSLSPLLRRLGQPKPPQPAAPQLAPSPAPMPAALPPAPAEVDPLTAAIARVAPLLKVGAEANQGQGGEPALYGQVLIDGFASEGVNLEGSLAEFEPGLLASLIAQKTGLSAEWLARVEDAIRSGEDDDEDDEPETLEETDVGARLPEHTDDTRVPFPPEPPFDPTPAPPAPTTKPARKPRARKDKADGTREAGEQ